MYKLERLPENILEKLTLLEQLKKDNRISALFLFGSIAKGELHPLSDLDIAVLIDKSFSKNELFSIHLEIIGEVLELLSINEVDVQLLNTAPPRFAHNILSTGKLVFCNNKNHLIDFTERNTLQYLDFKFYRDQFNYYFQQGIGIL